MRDLIFRNLTSRNKKKKMISSSEISEREGVHSVIRRHFIWIVKEVKDAHSARPSPYLYILKERSRKERKERFFCKIKGSLYAVHNDRLFLVLYMHSLRINLEAAVHKSAI